MTNYKKQKLIREANQKNQTLPMLLLFKRKSIREFPNGQKVAMYYSDFLKKEIAIPFDKNNMTGI